jgi:hypothetical protein
MKLSSQFNQNPKSAVMTVNRRELLDLERSSSFVKIKGLWWTLSSKFLGDDKYEVRLVQKAPSKARRGF